MNQFDKFKIGRFDVGYGCPPFIIAEMSGNHNHSLKRALKIVDQAASAGVNAIKLQTYTADTITLNCKRSEFIIKDKTSLWHNKNLYDLYKLAHTPWEWHKAIMDRAKSNNIECFSSPFDETAVDFLEKLNVPAYKIASFEINHIPLIRKAASTGKPLIISTGMAKENEIKEAVEAAKKEGLKKIILLKCTSNYPSSPKNSNLLAIPYLIKKFNCNVGLSDHTEGIGVPLAAITLGACVIEKHITLNKNDGGVDSKFSLDANSFSLLTQECKSASLWGYTIEKKNVDETVHKNIQFRFGTEFTEKSDDPPLIGVIDKYSNSVVTDYKTGQMNEEKHKDQVFFYSYLLHLNNKPVKKAEIKYSNKEQLSFDIDEEILNAQKDKINEQLNQINDYFNSDFPAKPEKDTCQFCYVKQMCEDYWRVQNDSTINFIDENGLELEIIYNDIEVFDLPIEDENVNTIGMIGIAKTKTLGDVNIQISKKFLTFSSQPNKARILNAKITNKNNRKFIEAIKSSEVFWL